MATKSRALRLVHVAILASLATSSLSAEGTPDQGGQVAMRMPGLRGENMSELEIAELALLFRRFDTITREVESQPNGIRTVTYSSDQAVMDALVNHAVGMIDRVSLRDDAQIDIQSPTLDMFFQHGVKIFSNAYITDEGLVVIQTSANPDLVRAMHIHAAEVTAMVDHGMAAFHDMMMHQERSE